MWGSLVLDVALGLMLVYLLLALAASAANEALAALLDSRAKYLARGLHKLLADPDVRLRDPATGESLELRQLFWRHPLIRSLQEDGTPPSYIPPRTFALALIDLLSEGAEPSLASLRTTVEKLPATSHVRGALLVWLNAASGSILAFQAHLEGWFDQAMARVSAWYRRNTQISVLLLSGLLAAFVNADSLALARYLALDPEARELIAERARSIVAEHADEQAEPEDSAPVDPAKVREQVQRSLGELDALGLPLGWQGRMPQDLPGWVSRCLGLLLTTLAASLGAPFWFDVLNKVVNVRSVGRRPGEQVPGKAAPPQPPPQPPAERVSSTAPVADREAAE